MKRIAVGVSGSAAMPAEGFHPVADTGHQIVAPHGDADVALDPGPTGDQADMAIDDVEAANQAAVPEASPVFVEMGSGP